MIVASDVGGHVSPVRGERTRVIVLAASVLTLALQVLLWSHVSDDAYISFRYIQRLLEGGGSP
jgi:hypothetical protein